ncbi:MAG: class I SAM-dependent rRNA methyltransferase [Terrimicrobiaceae bacterium]|nr:class I SAM-dependent rRNA methyltransferase [Terrimicrobiaceae bacterium]
MAGIIIRPRAGMLHGHDWVYGTEVLKVFGNPRDGDVISIKDGRDRLLGCAIYNSKSQIVARRISRRRQDLDADFFRRRIAQAAEVRDRAGCRRDLRRVVWSESDGLPGVIADQYGATVVLQTLTLAMDTRKAEIAAALADVLDVRGVVERNDTPVRAAEGLQPVAGILQGEPQTLREIEIGGVTFEIDLLGGQKTGFYLDQVANYAAVARRAVGQRVLDCFSNQGGFALACARAGAASVVAVESGAESHGRLAANAARNGLDVRCERADVTEVLRRAGQAGEKYDLIILDPPSFTKTRGRVHDAIRGYRDLHMRAGALLGPGGLLATFSCSHHVGTAAFLEAAAGGLQDAHRTARLIDQYRQSPDHPIVLHLPETFYLKGFLLEMMPGR